MDTLCVIRSRSRCGAWGVLYWVQLAHPARFRRLVILEHWPRGSVHTRPRRKAHPLSLSLSYSLLCYNYHLSLYRLQTLYHTLLASQFGSVPIFVYPGTCGPTHGSGHVYLGLYPAGRPSRHGSDTFISQPLKTVSAVMLRAGMLFRSRVR
jgi:hypothetical protein